MTQKRPSSSLMRSCFRESANSCWEIFFSLNFSSKSENVASASRNWSVIDASLRLFLF